MDLKNTLRKEIIEKLNTIYNKGELSVNIKKNIVSMPLWEKCDKLFLFISFKNEVITDTLISEAQLSGKKVYAPLIKGTQMSFHRIDNLTKKQLIKSSYGILEPPKDLPEVFPDRKSLMIIPGVAFTKKGSRLGRGGGYYDRYLTDKKDIIKIGITFEEQICNKIPTEKWDQKMNFVVTETNIYMEDYNGN